MIPRLGSNSAVDLMRFMQACCSPSGSMPICYLSIPYSRRKMKQKGRLIRHPSSLGVITRRNRVSTALIQSPTIIPSRCKIPRTPAGPSPPEVIQLGTFPDQQKQLDMQRCSPQKSKRYFISHVSPTVRSEILTHYGTEKPIKEGARG